MATREEIQAHLAALNAAWQLYDLLETRQIEPRYGVEHSNALHAVNRQYLSALAWLGENGVPEKSMVHERETLTWKVDDATLASASM